MEIIHRKTNFKMKDKDDNVHHFIPDIKAENVEGIAEAPKSENITLNQNDWVQNTNGFYEYELNRSFITAKTNIKLNFNSSANVENPDPLDSKGYLEDNGADIVGNTVSGKATLRIVARTDNEWVAIEPTQNLNVEVIYTETTEEVS